VTEQNHREIKRSGRKELQGDQEIREERITGRSRDRGGKNHREIKRSGREELQGNQEIGQSGFLKAP
jgi:hypothetical protein